MRFLRTNTAIRVTVGPFLDKTDGVTPETALTVTNCKLTFMVDDGNVPTLVLDTSPTASGGANDMVHVTGDDSGFYDLELAAANVNYLGRAMLALTDAANHCPVFHEFMILPAVIYDSFVLGTDLFDVSMTQILGSAVSSPATAGILDVNLKNIANATVSTSSAQLGVNVVNFGGAAGTFASGIPETKVASIAANAVSATAIATDAIDADALATDAVTEIKNAVTAALLATVVSGTAQGAGLGSDTIQLASGGVTADDQYNGYIIALVAGAGAGQQRQVLDSINTGDYLQVVGGNWTVAPNSTTVYILFAN